MATGVQFTSFGTFLAVSGPRDLDSVLLPFVGALLLIQKHEQVITGLSVDLAKTECDNPDYGLPSGVQPIGVVCMWRHSHHWFCATIVGNQNCRKGLK